MVRVLAVLAIAALPAGAQYTGLATTFDGSAVYFASTLRLKGTDEPDHGKLYVADAMGVRLLRSRPVAPPPLQSCAVGAFYTFNGAEVSNDAAVIAAPMRRAAFGGCSYPPLTLGADLIQASGETDLSGWVRVSPNGRYAIQIDTATGRGTDGATVTLFDLQSGTRTVIPVPQPNFANALRGSEPGRQIADDGTAFIGYTSGAAVIRNGVAQAFPVANARPLALDASGSHLLYQAQTLRLYDLRTGEDRTVLDNPTAFSITMSNDGSRIAFLGGNGAWIAQTDGSLPRLLTGESQQVTAAVLSGNGRTVYAATSDGRLVKIDADSAVQTEIIGRTPHVSGGGLFDAGLSATIYGGGLTDDTLTASAPLPISLGGFSITINGHAAAIQQVAPDHISFLTPWNSSGDVPVVLSVPPNNSPFDAPRTTITIGGGARAGAIAHQNWDGLVTFNPPSPPHVGEIIHIWAVGLGAVSPDVPTGAAAPLAEPFARLAAPMTCNDSDVLYAGLAPGLVERIYQIDLRLNTPGYRQFICTIGSGAPFIFVTLLVEP